MNFSRYIFLETLVTSIIAKCSECNNKMKPIKEDRAIPFLINIIKMFSAKNLQSSLFLKSIKDEILLQVKNVHFKQGEGFWPITTGDKIFIDYMNNIIEAIEAALGYPFMDAERMAILISRLEQILVGIKSDHNPEIKAVFLAQETVTWPSFESVYDAFVADSSCEAQLVYLPFAHVNSDKHRDWFAEYKDLGLPIIDHQDYDLSAESPDLVFFVKPYDGIPMQFYIDAVDRVVCRSVYIPYFVNWMAFQNIDFLIDYHFRLPLHHKAWKIFDAPKYIRDFHAHYGSRNGDNVELIGHPRFDMNSKLTKMKSKIPMAWKNKISDKKVFMWNTHSPMGSAGKKENDWATYELFGQNMLAYFNLHKDVILLWRPHPMFFNGLINNDISTVNEVEALIHNVENSENIILDTLADYRYAFSVSDALISDASSLLLEFFATNKPIMYSCRKSTIGLVNKALLPAYHKATTWDEIEDFIEIVREGRDDKRMERMNIKENVLVNYGEHIGELVKNTCKKEIITEEVISANKIVNKAFGGD